MNTVTSLLTPAYYPEVSRDFSLYYNILTNRHIGDTFFSHYKLQKRLTITVILPIFNLALNFF